jgi:hypothetical protein
MKSLSKAVFVWALLIAFALPGIGNDGGENGGGSGVWVLPRACFLTSQTGSSAPLAFATRPMNQDLVMTMSAEVGVASGTFLEALSSVPVAVPVVGSTVRVPASLLQALALLQLPQATVVVSDAAQFGYVLKITVNPSTGTVLIQAY